MVNPTLVSHRLLVFQPIPNGALEVLRKGGFDEPSRSSSHSVVERRSIVPAGVAAVTNRKRLRT